MKTIVKQKTLFGEIRRLIEDSKRDIAQTVNASLTSLYWNIGKIISKNILLNKRAEYGKRVIQKLSNELTEEYGRGWSVKQLQHCLHFVEIFPQEAIVSTLWREFSWSHFKEIIYLKTDLQRDFYIQMCRVERWSVRQLHKKIESLLFERTAISKKPEQLAKLELQKLKSEEMLSVDLVFKDHYVLDFLDLKDTYLEKDLEDAILLKIERFILELGIGFTFVARQKRMIIDNRDFYLDLLFFHRRLKRLIAIELKIGKFKASYKGQMELYLRWLQKYETEKGEELPIGLILCSEGNSEQIELLQLGKANIKVAEYITKTLPKKLLAKKLRQFSETSKKLLEGKIDGKYRK